MATTEIKAGSHAGSAVNYYSAYITGDGNDTLINLGFVARQGEVFIGTDIYEFFCHFPKTGSAQIKIYKGRVVDATGNLAIVVQDSGKTGLMIKAAILANAATAQVHVLGN